MGIEEAMAALGMGGKKDRAERRKPAKSKDMKEAFETLSVKHVFRPGDMIQWKAGMKNKKYPEYGEPTVISQLNPVVNKELSSGQAYQCEILDIACIHIDSDGDSVEFAYDSRRFEPYTGK